MEIQSIRPEDFESARRLLIANGWAHRPAMTRSSHAFSPGRSAPQRLLWKIK